MSIRNHFIFWTLVFAVFIAFILIFKSILLPFVLGIAVAYLLNPVVGKIGEAGIARGLAALLILSGFLLIITALLAAMVPVLYKELLELSAASPTYIDTLLVAIEPLSRQLQSIIGLENGAEIKALLSEHAGDALNLANHVIKGLAAGGQAIVSFISIIVIMPIVAYFMMKEWVHITQWANDLMPRHSKDTIIELLGSIDKKLSGFVRGQMTVALILGIFYALTLSLIGLKYGFLIGIASGLLSIIPMAGSTIGLLVSITVAWFQTSELDFVLMVGGIFIGGQLVEGNIITPKLVGDSVGLHPLWIFFALMAGGSLFGILGMLLAVPVAAIASVLLEFAIKQYKASSYYQVKAPKKLVKSEKKKRKNAAKRAADTA